MASINLLEWLLCVWGAVSTKPCCRSRTSPFAYHATELGGGGGGWGREEPMCRGVARVFFFTEALPEFQHLNCMIVRIWEVKLHAMLGAETFTEAVASVVSMVATPSWAPDHVEARGAKQM